MKIALVGNQNSGKTTLFNLLTGFTAKVGNYPGVTVEKKSGIIKGTNHELVDLPGIYSLSSYSIEEEVTTRYLIDEKPDLIINIIDSTTFERSLYLTTQLLDLNIRMILVLNMNDLLLKKGISIDEKKLSNILGVEAIKISALKNTGIDKLLKSIDTNSYKKLQRVFDSNIEECIFKVNSLLNKSVTNKRFVSIKLLEQDNIFDIYKSNEIDYIINSLSFRYSSDIYEEIINQRYRYIENVKLNVFKRVNSKISISDRIDKVLLNKYLSFPIFIIIMFFIYYLSISTLGKSLSDLICVCLDNFSFVVQKVLQVNNVSEWLISLIVNGIITGVSAVLVFIPQLLILFTCLSILETTGYMSRISLMFDSLFRKIGLSGKSIVPFIVGCGCSVPGILSSRVIEDKRIRNTTSILTPFIPCGAKLPIILMLTSYFYKENQVLIIMSLYLLTILVIIITSLLIKKYSNKKTNNTYIEELPEYKNIDIKYIFNDVYDKISAFVKRAGSIIFISSIVIWFLSSFSLKLKYGVSLDNTILSFIGKKISWIFYPMLGINSWQASVSIIQGLIAKEQVVSSLEIINDLSMNSFILSTFNKQSAYSFIVFNLFSAPCIATLSTLRKELRSNKLLLFVILYQILFSWILSTSIYQISTNFNILTLITIIVIIYIVFRIFKKNNCNYKCDNCKFKKNCKSNHHNYL